MTQTLDTARPLAVERSLYAFNLGFLETLLADVSDDELAVQPMPGINPPRWIAGHLAVVADGLLKMVGGDPVCPPECNAAFDGGSTANAAGAPAPTKAELLATLRENERRLVPRLDALTAEFLSGPNEVPFERARKAFPTKAEMFAFLMTSHFAVHLGQLSAWRRMTGRSPLF